MSSELRQHESVERHKSLTRGRQLTDKEAAKYDRVRKQIKAELPELVARHHARSAQLSRKRWFGLVLLFLTVCLIVTALFFLRP